MSVRFEPYMDLDTWPDNLTVFVLRYDEKPVANTMSELNKLISGLQDVKRNLLAKGFQNTV